jgi:hypothetical protein
MSRRRAQRKAIGSKVRGGGAWEETSTLHAWQWFALLSAHVDQRRLSDAFASSCFTLYEGRYVESLYGWSAQTTANVYIRRPRLFVI